MDRLTKRVGLNEAVPICDFDICKPFIKCGYCKTGSQGFPFTRWERNCNDICILGRMIDRLADYEDTGLTPEQILEMYGEMKTAYDGSGGPYMVEATGLQAKRIIDREVAEVQGRLVVLPCKMDAPVYDIRRYYARSKVSREEIVIGEIDHFTIGQAGKPIATVCFPGNEWAEYEPDDLILTPQEAEAALEKMKEG